MLHSWDDINRSLRLFPGKTKTATTSHYFVHRSNYQFQLSNNIEFHLSQDAFPNDQIFFPCFSFYSVSQIDQFVFYQHESELYKLMKIHVCNGQHDRHIARILMYMFTQTKKNSILRKTITIHMRMHCFH